MKVKGLDGREYTLKLTSKIIFNDDSRPRSSGHLLARDIIKKKFPYEEIYEEVYCPGCPTELYLDFLVAKQKIAFEICGKQHREFIPFFHGNKFEFIKQKKRDQSKLEWCNLNGIKLLRWDDCDTTERWEVSFDDDRRSDSGGE